MQDTKNTHKLLPVGTIWNVTGNEVNMKSTRQLDFSKKTFYICFKIVFRISYLFLFLLRKTSTEKQRLYHLQSTDHLDYILVVFSSLVKSTENLKKSNH